MYRLEASILVDNDKKRDSAKYIAVILDPSSVSLMIEDFVSTRCDGLCVSGIDRGEFGTALGAKILDPNHLDIGSIRRWLSTCEALHPITCKPQLSESLKSIFLIDTDTRRIVPYSVQTRNYLALSYKWGNIQQNTHGAGRIGTRLGKLPRTIEDSIILVQELGQRYLWVDSICISQSNENQLLQQIGIMSIIYQGAYATIVAFSGNSADGGLPRVGNTGTQYRQLSCEINGTQLVSFGPTLSQLAWVLPWARRSWTYQEAILSTRCIYISDYHTYFECNAMTCCETLDETQSSVHQALHDENWYRGENRFQKVNTGVLRSPLSANVDLEENALGLYSIYARLYSLRSMTKQSDAWLAFSGIIQALEKTTYKTGMSWALPNEDMNWALLWSAQYGQPRNEAFPRWSWLSWRGGIYPGEPEGDGKASLYPFNLTIWKRSPSGVIVVCRKKHTDMGIREQARIPEDPLTDPHPLEESQSLSDLAHLNTAQTEQLLCIESFMIRFSTHRWVLRSDYGNDSFALFKTKIDGLWITFCVPRTSDLYYNIKSTEQRQCLILARNAEDIDHPDTLAFYLLHIEFKEGFYKRVSPVRMYLPMGNLGMLCKFSLIRIRVILS